MQVARQILPKDWMLISACAYIESVLNEGVGEVTALFVGGCVRNLLLERPVKDIDLATSLTPEVVQKKCEAAGFKVIPTGLQHGTVTVIVDDVSFEVTTLRHDLKTDGRHAEVVFSQSWEEDAARRDFTMNTLLADTKGNIYDPTGRGIRDLEAGNVVFVGKPQKRIEEDYLRILRFFRFHACYGQGKPDQTALAACREFSDNIPSLSRERISQEFFKIISAEKAAETLEIMKNYAVLEEIVSIDLTLFQRLESQQKRHDLFHLAARLFVLLEQSPEKIKRVEKTYFVFTNQQKKFFQSFIKLLEEKELVKNTKELIYRYGKELAAQYFLTLSEEQNLEEEILLLRNWEIPQFPVSGADAQSIGIIPSPEMGRLLKQTEEWWVAQDFKPSKDECQAHLKKLLG